MSKSGLFKIHINYQSRRSYPQYEVEFTNVAKTWMSIIRGPQISLTINIRVVKVGEGQILGQAGPTEGIRIGKKVFPVAGVMEFDVWDIEQMKKEGTLHDVILHDMGHVLGIGCLWDDYLSDPVYSGKYALRGPSGGLRGGGGLREYEGGLLESGGLRTSGGCDGNWRETIFRTELMTGHYPEKEGVTEPLRQHIMGSLQDLGYGVDTSKSDLYTVPSNFQSFINLGSRPPFRILNAGKAKL
jgi:hypothetical protein